MGKSRIKTLQAALADERSRKSARIETLQQAIAEERKRERTRKAAARRLPENLAQAETALADLIVSIKARRQRDREALKAARYEVTKAKRRIAAAIRDGLLAAPGTGEDGAADPAGAAAAPASNPARLPTAHISEEDATGALLVRTSRPSDGFPAAARSLGGDWSRRSGRWRFPASRRAEALELVARHYESAEG